MRSVQYSHGLIAAARRLAPIAMSCLLAACTTYRPEPLPRKPDLSPSLSVRTIDASAVPLDMIEVATIAVERNPDLVAARKSNDVARAEAFAAGILPDPEISAGFDFPTAQTLRRRLINSYTFGLAEDLQSIVTHGAAVNSADAARDEVQLNVLWSEWQAIETACALYMQITFDDQRLEIIDRALKALKDQARSAEGKLKPDGDALDDHKQLLDQIWDGENQYYEIARDESDARANLNAALGLDPDVRLVLAPPAEPDSLSKEEIGMALTKVASTRPDLAALQAGYRSEEEALRLAILNEFPGMITGVQLATDEFSTHTFSPFVSMPIPIFGGARAAVKVQAASREQLRAEYQARLDQATGDSWRVWKHANTLRNQITDQLGAISSYERVLALSDKAVKAKALSREKYVTYVEALELHQAELLGLRQLLWADTISLHTLLGLPYLETASLQKPLKMAPGQGAPGN